MTQNGKRRLFLASNGAVLYNVGVQHGKWWLSGKMPSLRMVNKI